MSVTLDFISIESLSKLVKLSVQTFEETFGHKNTKENMAWYFKTKMNSKQLKKELLHPNSDFYWILFRKKIIGYLKLNFNDAQTEVVNLGESFEIERIYILSNFQQKGFGKDVLSKVISLGKNKGFSYLWLGVWEQNENAIAFYTKKGFEIFNRHVFQLGNDPQTDLLMGLKI
jgi:ribosomal protein S18 acetylase RimI-like enzyme